MNGNTFQRVIICGTSGRSCWSVRTGHIILLMWKIILHLKKKTSMEARGDKFEGELHKAVNFFFLH